MKSRITAVILVLALIVTSFTAGIGSVTFSAVAEGAEKVLSDELAGYRRITATDIIYVNTGKRAIQSDNDSDDSLFTVNDSWNLAYGGSFGGKTYLDIDMNFNGFTKGGEAALNWQGNARYKNGFYLYMVSSTTFRLAHYNDDSKLTTLCDAAADFGISPTTWFNVKLLINVEKSSASAGTEIVTWQCWINDKFAGEGSFDEAVHDRKAFTTKSGTVDYRLTMRVPKVFEEEFDGYERVSFSEFQNGNGNVTSIPNTSTGLEISGGNQITFRCYNSKPVNNESPESSDAYSLNKTYFDFDINQNGSTSDLSSIFLYERKHWYDDIVLYWTDANTFKAEYRKTNAEGTAAPVVETLSFDLRTFGRATNSEFFNVKVRSDFSANSADATKRDAVIQIWINNRFAGEFDLTATDMRNALVIRKQGATSWYLRESKYLETELDGYRRIDMYDYNKAVTNGIVSFAANDTATSYITDFDKTYLDVDVNYNGNINWGSHMLQYQGSAKYKTAFYLGFAGDAGIFRFSSYKNESSTIGTKYDFNASEYGISPSEYFNIKLRTDITHKSGTVDSVLAQLWINNKFACEVTVEFTYSAAGTHNKTYMGTAGAPVSVRSSTDADTQLKGYKRMVADDFDSIGATFTEEGTLYASALAGEYTGNVADFSKCYFDIDIKTTNSMNPFLVWLSKNKSTTTFYGDGYQLRFYLETTGDVTTLKMMKVAAGKSAGTVVIGDITASPYNYNPDEFFNIKIKTTKYDTTTIGLIIFFNDILIKNIYINNYDAETVADMTCAGIRGTADPDYTYARTPSGNLELKDDAYDLSKGAYLLKGASSLRVNGVLMNPGDTLNTPGDYYIERLIGGKTSSIQRVSLYRIGDVNVDGSAFETGTPVWLDSYAAECIVEFGTTVRASYLAADINNDGLVDSSDVSLFKTIRSDVTKAEGIISKHFGKSVSYDYLGGNNVMPIAGYYGPDEYTKANDETYRLLSESGINIINYLPFKWGAANSRDVLRNLALAQKYGIGIYVSDANMNTVTVDENDKETVVAHSYLSSASDLANAMSQYAAYSSFLGIHVFDEPKPATGDSRYGENYYGRYKYYQGLLQALKPFSNITGYINLHGAGAFEPGDYRSYLESIVDDVDYLSFDAYPYFEKDYPLNWYKLNGYFESLDQMRVISRENNKPFWSFVQAGTDYRTGSGDNGPTTGYYTLADTLWNVNTSLAFGAKGIEWFPLMQPEYFSSDTESESGHDYDRNGLIGANGETTRYYNMVKHANTQIAAVDDVLMNADSKGVIVTGNAASDISSAATQRSYTFESILNRTGNKYTNKLKNVTTNKAAGAMVGCFDYKDTEAYYVTNYSRTDGDSQQITLTFNTNYDVTIIKEGVTYNCDSSSYVNMNIGSGEGVLVVLGNSNDIVIDGEVSNYTLSGDAVINNVQYSAGTVFTNSGDYNMAVTNSFVSYAHTVVIYRAGDVNVDSEVNVNDLVRYKRILIGSLPDITNAGAKAIEVLGEPKYKSLIAKILN